MGICQASTDYAMTIRLIIQQHPARALINVTMRELDRCLMAWGYCRFVLVCNLLSPTIEEGFAKIKMARFAAFNAMG